jgi:hypothetical protein
MVLYENYEYLQVDMNIYEYLQMNVINIQASGR